MSCDRQLLLISCPGEGKEKDLSLSIINLTTFNKVLYFSNLLYVEATILACAKSDQLNKVETWPSEYEKACNLVCNDCLATAVLLDYLPVKKTPTFSLVSKEDV